MKIIIYAGYHNPFWNDETRGLGGTETAMIELARSFPLSTEVFIVGDVIDKDDGRIKYVHTENLDRTVNYDAVIAMSYINYLEELRDVRFTKSFFQFHNTDHHPWWRGTELPDMGNKLFKDERLPGIVCLTEWHKKEIEKRYEGIIDKEIIIIGDGVVPVQPGPIDYEMSPMKFVYASHPARGLEEAIAIWNVIKEKYLNAEFHICTPLYGESELKNYVTDQYRIYVHNSLDKYDYNQLLKECHFWLYPTQYDETCCMVALDMQMNGVIPITTRHAALHETVSTGLFIEDKSVNDIINFIDLLKKSPEIVNALVMKGKEFAHNQSWERKAKEWLKILKH